MNSVSNDITGSFESKVMENFMNIRIARFEQIRQNFNQRR